MTIVTRMGLRGEYPTTGEERYTCPRLHVVPLYLPSTQSLVSAGHGR
jgi:hypothetical protein